LGTPRFDSVEPKRRQPRKNYRLRAIENKTAQQGESKRESWNFVYAFFEKTNFMSKRFAKDAY
jgi:hypothetical protein